MVGNWSLPIVSKPYKSAMQSDPCVFVVYYSTLNTHVCALCFLHIDMFNTLNCIIINFPCLIADEVVVLAQTPNWCSDPVCCSSVWAVARSSACSSHSSVSTSFFFFFPALLSLQTWHPSPPKHRGSLLVASTCWQALTQSRGLQQQLAPFTTINILQYIPEARSCYEA